MLIAIIAIAALWILAGLTVIGATNLPADSAAIALADTTPVVRAPKLTLAA